MYPYVTFINSLKYMIKTNYKKPFCVIVYIFNLENLGIKTLKTNFFINNKISKFY